FHAAADESSIKLFGRDADDGVRDVVEALRLADDRRIAFEARLPEVITDHDHRMRIAAHIFARFKAATEDRMDTNRVKIICGDDTASLDLPALVNAKRGAPDRADKQAFAEGAVSLHIEQIRPRGFIALATESSSQRHEAILMRHQRIRP